jgi:uncharacterized protein (DUF2141 family)
MIHASADLIGTPRRATPAAFAGLRAGTAPATAARRAISRLLSGVALVALLPAAQAASLDLEVTGIVSAEGRLMVALFPSEERFRGNPLEARSLEARPGSQRLRFDDLPAGRYAVAVFHDRNGNGVLDTNLLGVPTEPAAFSGEPARLGPSSWSQASFPLDAGGARIVLRLPR